jgi:hypothetical protein
MKRTTKESTELVKVETLEADVCFEIIELEDQLLGMITGGAGSNECPIVNRCEIHNQICPPPPR